MNPIEQSGGVTTIREPTDILAKRFLKSPGVEGEQLEFKSKAKVESNAGRQEVVQTIVGMANRWGGTIIIGVNEDGATRIEPFSRDSEAKRDLTNLIRDNTEPNLSTSVEIDFDHVENGKHVLRIDVERTDYELYKFNKQGNDGYVLYWRIGDTTREMTREDSIEFAESRRSSSNQIGYSQTETVGCLPRYNSPTTDVQLLDHRVIAVSDGGIQPVFGAQLLSRNKPLVFELDTQFRIEALEEVEGLLDRAIEYLSVNPNSVVYSIHQSTRTWCGRGVDRLNADFEQIDSVVEQMLGGHPRNIDDEITHLDPGNGINCCRLLLGSVPCRTILETRPCQQGAGRCQA